MATKSWLPIPDDHEFSIENLPFGIFSTRSNPTPRPGIALGDYVVDLAALASNSAFQTLCPVQFPLSTLHQTTLNDFAALGRKNVNAIRLLVRSLFLDTTPMLRDDDELKSAVVVNTQAQGIELQMHLPFDTRDFTDYLNSKVHAKNTHSTSETPINMFNPPRAFCGRVSSLVVSGTPIVRPVGHLVDTTGQAYAAPSNELDVEIEFGFFVGVGSQRFERIRMQDAEEHIFGVVMLNDWSTVASHPIISQVHVTDANLVLPARDIQKFEDHPFGAFSCKSFASTISPWVVTLDALAPFKVEPKPQEPLEIPPYLADTELKGTYDISIRMSWALGKEKEIFTASTSNLQNAYWSFKQMLTYHALGGCQMRTGDLVGTGTITGEEEDSICSLVEKTRDGKIALQTPAGNRRMYVDDGDEVVFTAWAGNQAVEMPGKKVGFGQCSAVILPAKPL